MVCGRFMDLLVKTLHQSPEGLQTSDGMLYCTVLVKKT